MKTTPTYKNLPHSFLMSVALCLFGVFFSSQAYAQHEDLLDKTWYLYKLEIDGEEYPYHNLDIQSGDESRMKVIDYNINELTASILFDGCPGSNCSLEFEFIENESKIILYDMPCLTSDVCRQYEDLDYSTISQLFHEFFRDNNGIMFEYDIIIIDTIEYLIFTDENEDKIYYSAINLSTPDFEEIGFSLYPNPAQDWLHIHLEKLSYNSSLEVYDMHGKLLERIMLSELETQLDVSEFASGIYFIKMTDELGSRQVKKFIKQ
ncbi:MAG TPA: T9SS type A sorting domain-containing protein [Flavobacteriaceae bacterium]|nr:T9SS type A sorting domain-containing protein [Flavobacteriaceae bacterium]